MVPICMITHVCMSVPILACSIKYAPYGEARDTIKTTVQRYCMGATTKQRANYNRTAAQHSATIRASSYHASNLPIAIFNCTCDWKVLQRYRRCTSGVGGINAPVQISKVQERQESGKNLMNTVLGEGKREKNPPENGIYVGFHHYLCPCSTLEGLCM